MTTTTLPLARSPAGDLARCIGDPACPVRFRYGRPRLCSDHDDARTLGSAASALGIDLSKQPGDRGDGDHEA